MIELFFGYLSVIFRPDTAEKLHGIDVSFLFVDDLVDCFIDKGCLEVLCFVFILI